MALQTPTTVIATFVPRVQPMSKHALIIITMTTVAAAAGTTLILVNLK